MVFRYSAQELAAEEDLVLEARKLCLSTPLRPYDRLEWKGPSLYPNSLAPRQDTNQQRRTPIDILLSKRSPARSIVDHQWTLSLLEPIQVARPGSDLDIASQLWKCQVQCAKFDVGDEMKTTVVLKIYYPGIYDHNLEDKQYTNHHGLAEGEAIAYERFKHLQGSDVLFCYGFFKFTTPQGQELTGEVLEDLTASKTLIAHVNRAHSLSSGVEERKIYIDRMITGILRSRCRLNLAGIILMEQDLGNDILVLPPLSSRLQTRESELLQSEETHNLVMVGFGHTRTLEEYKRHAYEGEDLGDDPWKDCEYSAVMTSMFNVFGFEQRNEWVKMEEKRGLISEYEVYSLF